MENLEKAPEKGRKILKARRAGLNGKVKGTRRLGDNDNGRVSKSRYSENNDQSPSNSTEAESQQ